MQTGHEIPMTGNLQLALWFSLMIHQSLSATRNKVQFQGLQRTEAEYRSMVDTISKIMWLTLMVKDLHIELKARTSPFYVHCDNVSALALATNPVYYSKLQHVEIDVPFTRVQVKQVFLKLKFVTSSDQLADLFTKGLCSISSAYLYVWQLDVGG